MVGSRGTAGQVIGLHVRLPDELGTAGAQGRTPGATNLAIGDPEVRARPPRTVVGVAVRVLESPAAESTARIGGAP